MSRKRRKKPVEEPLTEELLEELIDAPSPDAFLADHDLALPSLHDYLNQMLAEKNLRRVDVIHEAGLNETYGYEMFTGAKASPSRDKLLALALAMHLNLTETNRLLKIRGVSELYCKNRRDAIILFCINHSYSLQKTDEELYRFNEETIAPMP